MKCHVREEGSLETATRLTPSLFATYGYRGPYQQARRTLQAQRLNMQAEKEEKLGVNPQGQTQEPVHKQEL